MISSNKSDSRWSYSRRHESVFWGRDSPETTSIWNKLLSQDVAAITSCIKRISVNGSTVSAAGQRRRRKCKPTIARRVRNPQQVVQEHTSAALSCRPGEDDTSLPIRYVCADVIARLRRPRMDSEVRDYPTMSRFEMPVGGDALAVSYYKGERSDRPSSH